MKHFYVYYSYEEYGRGYIGKRECECCPEEDKNYFGSFKDKTFSPTQKIILETFENVEEALEAECALHDFYEVDKNPHFANRAKQTSTGFYFNRKGQKHPKISGDNHPSKREELRKNLSEKRKGDKNPMYGMTGEKNPFFGRKHTKESKDKIGLSSKNRKHTEESKNKLKIRNINRKWWVNPDGIRKFQQECPGVEWKRGMVYK
jgi:hypothetical protein